MRRDAIRVQIALVEGEIIALQAIADRKGWGPMRLWPTERVQRLAALKSRARELRAEMQRGRATEVAA